MENKTTEILKMAIIMENRGKSLYQMVALQSANEDLKQIFRAMAEEEQLHIDFLTRQLQHYQKTNTIGSDDFANSDSELIAESILTEKIINDISGAGFEAAAISAAIDMESKSVEVYQNRANETDDENEKKLYQWLADWEKGHFALLVELNQRLTEKIWYDNKFWPF